MIDVTKGDVVFFGELQIMVPFAYEEFIGNLTQMVKSGAIPVSRIDDAVTRILRVKFQMGLFESPYADTKLIKTLGQEVSTHFYFATDTCNLLLHLCSQP